MIRRDERYKNFIDNNFRKLSLSVNDIDIVSIRQQCTGAIPFICFRLYLLKLTIIKIRFNISILQVVKYSILSWYETKSNITVINYIGPLYHSYLCTLGQKFWSPNNLEISLFSYSPKFLSYRYKLYTIRKIISELSNTWSHIHILPQM